jgi:spore maturation protein CgeB
LRGHRPTFLDEFSQYVLETCQTFKPDYLLVTGITPPGAAVLRAIQQMGITTINYLTDDPWNKAQASEWFFKALPHYAAVYSPRRANIHDLRKRVAQVEYLPVAYDPVHHYPEAPPADMRAKLQCDVLFYGGADQDRISYVEALVDAGISVHIYGGYWKHFSKTQSAWRGVADYQTLRWAVSSASLTLCLVRRANRDGHVMRSFEAPAMGACLLAEATDEHRELFGDDGAAVAYFQSEQELVARTQALLKDEALRGRLAQNAHQLITHQPNTYQDRLRTMLGMG